MNWISQTKQVVAQHKARFEPMTFVLPAQVETCIRCGEKISKTKQIVHDMDDRGNVIGYCSDECFFAKIVV